MYLQLACKSYLMYSFFVSVAVHSVRNKASYFAERLYKSMKVYNLS